MWNNGPKEHKHSNTTLGLSHSCLHSCVSEVVNSPSRWEILCSTQQSHCPSKGCVGATTPIRGRGFEWRREESIPFASPLPPHSLVFANLESRLFRVTSSFSLAYYFSHDRLSYHFPRFRQFTRSFGCDHRRFEFFQKSSTSENCRSVWGAIGGTDNMDACGMTSSGNGGACLHQHFRPRDVVGRCVDCGLSNLVPCSTDGRKSVQVYRCGDRRVAGD